MFRFGIQEVRPVFVLIGDVTTLIQTLLFMLSTVQTGQFIWGIFLPSSTCPSLRFLYLIFPTHCINPNSLIFPKLCTCSAFILFFLLIVLVTAFNWSCQSDFSNTMYVFCIFIIIFIVLVTAFNWSCQSDFSNIMYVFCIYLIFPTHCIGHSI